MGGRARGSGQEFVQQAAVLVGEGCASQQLGAVKLLRFSRLTSLDFPLPSPYKKESLMLTEPLSLLSASEVMLAGLTQEQTDKASQIQGSCSKVEPE